MPLSLINSMQLHALLVITNYPSHHALNFPLSRIFGVYYNTSCIVIPRLIYIWTRADKYASLNWACITHTHIYSHTDPLIRTREAKLKQPAAAHQLSRLIYSPFVLAYRPEHTAQRHLIWRPRLSLSLYTRRALSLSEWTFNFYRLAQ